MKPTTTTKIALDTNIVIYYQVKDDARKWSIASELMNNRPVVSAQVVSEYLNVMRRRLPVAKEELMALCAKWVSKCEFHHIEKSTLEAARQLIIRYDFQLFDSIVVAAALQANCIILYSEDMYSGQVVENRLTIINPFL